MKNLINAIKKSLQNNNWYSALFTVLALPDICGKISFPSDESKSRYIKWFNKYVGNNYKHNENIFLSGGDCYALRCSYFHEGSDVIINQRAKEVLDKFIFASNVKSHCNTIKVSNNFVLQINVELFCKDFINGAEKCLKDFSPKKSGMIKIHDKTIPIGSNTLI